MKLSVAANYAFDLVSQLAEFPVAEVYGKFPVDTVGGGRPSYMGTPLTQSDLAAYVAILDRHGIAFNYLLNSSCLGNREWGKRWQKKLMRLLESLALMGIRRLTVSTPYLLERIKAAFPGFYVKVGIYAQIDTPRRARFWRDLGADALTLESFSINRDFATLRAIREAVSGELQLIANHPCLPNCPMQPYHQNGFAHASDGSRQLFLDYCFLSCTLKRLEDPSHAPQSRLDPAGGHRFLRSAGVRALQTPGAGHPVGGIAQAGQGLQPAPLRRQSGGIDPAVRFPTAARRSRACGCCAISSDPARSTR